MPSNFSDSYPSLTYDLTTRIAFKFSWTIVLILSILDCINLNSGPTFLTMTNNPIPNIGVETKNIRANFALIVKVKNNANKSIKGALTNGLIPLHIAF